MTLTWEGEIDGVLETVLSSATIWGCGIWWDAEDLLLETWRLACDTNCLEDIRTRLSMLRSVTGHGGE
jgi:hypothetical protein